MPRQKKPRDTSFYGGPEDLGGHYPGKIGPGNTSRATAFSRERQPDRARSYNLKNAPAEHGWSTYQLRDPAERPKSLLITDVGELGADLLEEMVSYDVGGRTEHIPFIMAAMKRARKYLIGGSRRDFTEAMRFFQSLGTFEKLAMRQNLRAEALEDRNKEWWQGYHAELFGRVDRLRAWDEQATPEQKQALDRECAEYEEQQRLKALQAKERRRRRLDIEEDDISEGSELPIEVGRPGGKEADGADPVAEDCSENAPVPSVGEFEPAVPEPQSEASGDSYDLWAPETLVGHEEMQPENSPLTPDSVEPSKAAVPPPPSLADLKAASRRVRKGDAEQVERVLNLMKVLGYIVPIIINAKNQIIDGHIVAEAAERLGLETIQCLVVEHLTADEERLARIALNRLAEQGAWDLETLSQEMSELEANGIDLGLTGFDPGQLDLILGNIVDSALTSDSVPKVSVVATSQPGDLWLLGEHRLYCGDAREPESYQRLLQGEKIDCVFSDPPYNIKIDGVVSGLGKVKHGDFAMGCGEMSDDGFRTFLGTYLQRCREHCAEGAVIFACMDWRQVDLLLLAGRDAGLERINKVIWFKGSGGMGGLYRSAYEEIAVFCTAKSAGTNNVQLGRQGRNRTNVWEYPGANRMGSSAKGALADHPTPKPVELVADALLDVTKRGDIVLDPFMGSGTTIMACEKEKRLGRGIEFDPVYVDVAIRRWQEATGKVAVHAHHRMTFEQVTAERAKETRDGAASEGASV